MNGFQSVQEPPGSKQNRYANPGLDGGCAGVPCEEHGGAARQQGGARLPRRHEFLGISSANSLACSGSRQSDDENVTSHKCRRAGAGHARQKFCADSTQGGRIAGAGREAPPRVNHTPTPMWLIFREH